MARKSDNYDVNSLSQDEIFEILSGNSADMEVPEKKSRKEVWKIVGIAVAVVAVITAVVVGVGIYFEKQHQKDLAEEEKKKPKEGMTFFLAEEEKAEKSKDDINTIITQACYTNDGSLAVYFAFGNGMDKDQHLNSIEVKIYNEKEELIASGFSDAISDGFTIPKDGDANLLLYISPEYVKIKNDPLSVITYDVTIDYQSIG